MQSKNNWKAWLYLAPVLILLSVFTFYPLINTIGISFLKNYDYMTQTSDGFTFENYAIVLGLQPYRYMPIPDEVTGELVQTPMYITDVVKFAIPNTAIITFVTVPISILIALAMAICLNSITSLRKVFQTIFFLPYVTNGIAVGMVFSVIFAGNSGIFNAIFGIPEPNYWINVSADWGHGMFALCFYIIWKSLPYKVLIFLSGLQNIDNQYYDAAKMDSAPKMRVISKITIPLLSPQVLYITITSFIGAFKEYDSIVGLFGTAPQTSPSRPNNMLTIVYYVYNTIGDNRVHYGSAAAVLLFVVILVFTVVEMQVSKKRVHY